MSSTDSKYILSLDRKLFLSVVSIFLIFVATFIAYQFLREKAYKAELLNSKLQDYNELINNEWQENPKDADIFREFIKCIDPENLRITIIKINGEIIYDSTHDFNELGNHLHRKEVTDAIKKGNGYDQRVSQSTGVHYFYSATLYKDYIIRTALPYDTEVEERLRTDMHYIWFTIPIALVLIFFFYKLTRRLGKSIRNLKEFANRIEQNKPFVSDIEPSVSHDELSDISNHIIQIYQKLLKTQKELSVERDKLIMHLQTAKEGLAVFSKEKKEILANNLFIQYINIISDYNLKNTEEIFGVHELQPITDFVVRNQKKLFGKEEKRTSITINKSGRCFTIECILFQNLSFEIAINDITQEEEQSLLKRQLTQNIAHELKTPVSSIQAYLETIVCNEDLPPGKQKLFLTRCYEQSNRLARLLRDISVLTRMDEAVGILEIERVDISSLVDTILNELSLETEAKQITIINQLKEGIEIRGNHSLLYSVFRNLMDNSIAYGGNEIQIIINCFREDESFYYFSFADTGIGVSDEHLQRLFDRFYRIDKGRSRKLGGTGLGLAIVKNAIHIHGGKISAKHFQGGGLEFIFTLAKDK